MIVTVLVIKCYSCSCYMELLRLWRVMEDKVILIIQVWRELRSARPRCVAGLRVRRQ